MSSVYELLVEKRRQLHTTTATSSVLDATRLMNDCGIGAVVVTDDNRIVGIFTERDVLRRVVAMERSPAATRVLDVMTAEVLCCSPATTIEQASEIMMERRIRHLPIVNDDGLPVGMISIGDLNAHQVHEQQQHIGNLQDYLYGRV
ncbi:MAG: hypothetical protein B7Z55_07580 [Planctomycetales bacterium 12-60-4]|nr:MAG: hypothetical protein B7Z55_07580 [Planctomycetales bacterium 12-60-4]